MMRGRRFAGDLLFAAFAALGSIPWMMTAGVVGREPALSFYQLLVAVLYLVWIAPSWPWKLRAGLLGAVAAVAVALLVPAPAVGAALLLAVGRGLLFHSRSPARTLAIEAFLVGGGLLFARALGGPSLLDLAFAIWGFYLVQSVYFLIGGVQERRGEEPGADPFNEARRRVLAVLEET